MAPMALKSTPGQRPKSAVIECLYASTTTKERSIDQVSHSVVSKKPKPQSQPSRKGFIINQGLDS
ncbi:hypothetical protein N7530_004467 [Penicillium desertorum]|uniref:Uncharacterized protein n=1 Tax=Penicillium desertorum TaxID=1303715 RepID=A0A9X0BQJ5_9EURO|nr:hypothetical protein N7530_004467 [Penicillium desertorum]